MLTKAAIIISAILVFAGVAAAGTLTSGSSSDTPTITTPTLPTTSGDVQREDRRANDAGEDLRGPCGEAEHANDPRCTSVNVPAHPGGVDDNDHHGQNRGHGGENGSSGHGRGNSGHGGGADD